MDYGGSLELGTTVLIIVNLGDGEIVRQHWQLEIETDDETASGRHGHPTDE